MTTERANDLRAFCDFADEKLSNGGAELTLEEALSLWKFDNAADEEREEALRAVRRSIVEIHARRHSLPPRR